MRAKVIQIRRLTREEQRINALLYPERGYWRPQTRGDCVNLPRPCPYVACRHHLYLDVDERAGSIRLNYPGKEVWELKHTCSLDIAGYPQEPTLEDMGEIMAVTRERVRQIESVALSRLKSVPGARELIEHLTGRRERPAVKPSAETSSRAGAGDPVVSDDDE